jgi:hypothetical protein
MFPDERIFLITDHKGRKVSTIVQDSDLKNIEDDHGAIEVRIIGMEGDITQVMLPGEVLDSSRILTVRNSEFQNGSRNGFH